jgi:membrane glycosyltransferase
MGVSTYLLWYHENSGLSDIAVHAFTPFLRLTEAQHGALIFTLVMTILFLPKALSLVNLAFNSELRREFGGMGRAALGVVFETIFSTLHAPLQMLFHTKFVCSALFGFEIRWGTQRRNADGCPWGLAMREHWMHTLIGVLWGVLVWRLDPHVFGWFVPVLAGMVLSIPVSVWTSRESAGQALRNACIFLTPEECAPPPELEALQAASRQSELFDPFLEDDQNLQKAVLDPYLNAVHISLLREQEIYPRRTKAGISESKISASEALAERLLVQGPGSLTKVEKLAILLSAESMAWLHREAWLRPKRDLAVWWGSGFDDFGRRQ